MADDANTLQYWLNWRVFACEIGLLLAMFAALLLIWRFDGPASERHNENMQQKRAGTVYADESWRPCLKQIHPAWLLAFRIFSFFIFWTMFIISLFGGAVAFYFYTEWTLILVTTYFGLGSVLSIHGCYQFMNKYDSVSLRVDQTKVDEEQGSNVSPTQEERRYDSCSAETNDREHNICKLAGVWGYFFQIIYQTSAGAAMFTDVVFWSIIYPSGMDGGFWETFVITLPHSVNVIFLLGDTALNSMRFPFFRISYLVLLTTIYIILQWVLHACFSLWWPYPFLDLSPSDAPLRYLSLGLLLIPCYAVFFLIIELKHRLLLRWFPRSHQFLKCP